jgi:cytochrome c oxidase subunit 3
MNQVCLRIQLRSSSGFKAHPELLIRTVITKDKRKQFSRESVARLSQAHCCWRNLVETNTEVNYLLTSFLYHWFRIPRFLGNHKYYHIFQCISWTYEKRKSYEMGRKKGLYWHFVDLVWVFVFTVFYLV